MKKLFTILAALVVTGGLLYAGVNYNSLPAPESGNTAAFVPGSDDSTDLGSTTLEFRNLYIDGTANIDVLSVSGATTLTGDITASADIRVSSVFGLSTAEAITVTTAVAIVPTSSYVILRSTTADVTITMSAKPFITATNFQEGDFLILTTTDTTTFTFTEGNEQGLQLGDSTRTIGNYDTLTLIYCSSGTAVSQKWFQEVSFVDN